MPLVLTYRAAVLLEAADPWRAAESTVFRTKYAALYAVTWTGEVYDRYWLWYLPRDVREVLSGCADALQVVIGKVYNVHELYVLMAVEETVN